VAHAEITALLDNLRDGDGAAVDALLPFVYDELQALAARQLRRERSAHTLNPTALVHEAYVKLVDQREGWRSRAHFFGVAALAMRRILVHYAERRAAEKRGGGAAAVTLVEDGVAREAPAEEVVALDEALGRLATFAERPARVVEMRFFGGLTQDEIAEALSVSVPTVQRDWQTARAWLGRELAADP
jgi:RNA polymerase sigma factor (TIGR02999 family)